MSAFMRLGRGARVRRATCQGAVALALAATSACATHNVASGERAALRGVPEESLESHIARVLAVSSAATSAPATAAGTLEQGDAKLSAALTAVIAAPTAHAYRQVGLEYRRLGVLDMAYRHFSKAVELDRKDAASFDMRARIWRDWGFPVLGYADAYRAIELAPRSAAAANTLGTLFEAAGNPGAARVWYERAITLEPAAAYALNNLCYLFVMRAESNAVAACRRALEAAPDSVSARNNLALAYAAGDEDDAALAQFTASVDAAAAQYNMGIVYMARRQYPKALDAFAAALRLNPSLPQATALFSQARQAMGTD